MAQMIEFDLARVLEDIRQEIKENNRKLDDVNTNLSKKIDDVNTNLSKKIDDVNTNLNNKIDRLAETTQKDLTDIKVNQAKLQGRVEIVQVILGTLILLVFTVTLKVFDVFPKT